MYSFPIILNHSVKQSIFSKKQDAKYNDNHTRARTLTWRRMGEA